uniref:NADH dehydrogenase subunit 2 n=1 Tax=Cunedda sp. 1 SJ-2023a TaxID=3040701 RepID=UPI002551F7B1|nr:NADH dehydrogenase subunit 2 [Cunedda sp. 1 SJ-2023a]WGC89443.1 NADH dehydrogenase subunit 2 [Cunedda sp. 1 SJ-2023a]
MNSSLLLFFYSMILGVMVSLCSNNFITIWLGLEISLVSFLPMMVNESLLSSESSMKYFIIQAISSSLLLLGVMMMIMNYNWLGNLIIYLSLMIKIGVAPFHSWVLSVVEGLSYFCLFILLFMMKLVPLFISSLMNISFMLVALITMIFGAISGLIQNSIRKLLALSSIYNLGLIISCIYEVSIWVVYFFVYGLILLSLLFLIENLNSSYLNQIITVEFDLSKKFIFWLVMLSMGGLPPFLGFFNKLIVIEFLILNDHFLTSIVLILTALMVIFYYIRLSFISLMFFSLTLKFNLVKVSNVSFLIILINLMAFPFIILYNSLT